MAKTRKPYQTRHDAECDRLFNPPPFADNGPEFFDEPRQWNPEPVGHAFFIGVGWGFLIEAAIVAVAWWWVR